MKINSLLHQLEVLASGWEKYAINETFSGYTLEQLQALIQALRELLAVMDALKLDYRGKIAARQTMGTELGDIRLRTKAHLTPVCRFQLARFFITPTLLWSSSGHILWTW